MPRSVPKTPSAGLPLGPYSPAVEANGLVFLSGQVAGRPDNGRGPDDVAGQTHQVMRNIGAILDDLGLDYADIVKTTVFLGDIGHYPTVNEVYGSYFSGPPPARSAFEVGALPGGAMVEIEVVAAR